ncbi:hypothetical protein LTR05_007882 [Lithohypha guttulata]|uniref:Uncharacterized protein n=1 Tax=Lithohypha guttulata TaxID=1690604 RepID=A0AAN7Y431_9EURO|nr:hypothetical protein LTR05_007882 [Lithohypha guttulata]
MTEATRLSNALVTAAKTPITLLQATANEPLITGPLLYILTRGSADIRQRLLNLPYVRKLFERNGGERLALAIKTLKVLFVLGVIKRLNQGLNRIALNGWQLPGTNNRARWNWDGRTETVVITGGCSGFGYEMVKGFARKAKVIVIDVSELPAEFEKLPEVHYYKCDLTDTEAVVSTCASIKNRFGHPTVLINNAGIGSGKTILDTPHTFTDAIFKVNLSSHFVLIKEFLPGMLEKRKGHIVGIASMASFVSAPGLVDYCVTKAGVLALHEGLRNELLMRYENGSCVASTTVHPSWHATGIVKPWENKLKEHGIRPDPPKNVADAVVEQVLAHRSGRIYMPRSAESQAGTRQLPLWLQDWFLGVVSINPFAKSKGFQFDNA